MTEKAVCSRPCFVVGYGNVERRDDGLGRHVVGRLGRRPGLKGRLGLLKRRELTPDLIEDLREAERIFLVDASVESLQAGWRIRRIWPDPAAAPYLTHSLEPGYLLALMEKIHGRRPQAFLVSIQGEDFGSGRGLSAAARKRADRVVSVLARLAARED